ncbi:MAG: hemin uptake protein HemP [Comamonas sp.]
MHSTLSTSSAYRRNTLVLGTESQDAPSGQLVHSGELLQGQKAIQIQHNGSVYLLQATKLGKLILTK